MSLDSGIHGCIKMGKVDARDDFFQKHWIILQPIITFVVIHVKMRAIKGYASGNKTIIAEENSNLPTSLSFSMNSITYFVKCITLFCLFLKQWYSSVICFHTVAATCLCLLI